MKNQKLKPLLSALLITSLAISSVIGLTACSSFGNQESQISESASLSSEETKSSAAQTGEPVTVRIGYPSSGGTWLSGIAGVANYNGYIYDYLKPLGYEAEFIPFLGAAPAIHEALASDALDYVVYAGMAAALSKGNGLDHTLISVSSWGSNWRLIAREGAGVESVKDLKGKKIGYTRGASPHMFLINALKAGGVSWDEIEAVNATGPEALAGITDGSIDATVVQAGFEESLVEKGTVKVIFDQFSYNDGELYEPSVFIARTAFHKEHPEVAVAIQKAFLKARDWANEDLDRYYNLQAEQSGNPLSIILQTAIRDLEVAAPLNLDETYINSLKSIQEFLKENELYAGDGQIDYETWIDQVPSKTALEEYISETQGK